MVAWEASQVFRGVVDVAEYRQYVLAFWLWRFLSDGWAGRPAKDQPGGDLTAEAHRLRSFFQGGFHLPKGCDFASVWTSRRGPDLGPRINEALRALERANPDSLAGVLTHADFDFAAKYGSPHRGQALLNDFFDRFADPSLDLNPFRVAGAARAVGDAFELLLENFARAKGKPGSDPYTPHQVSSLLARLLQPRAGQTICDPTCGSGSLLLQLGLYAGSDGADLFGQDSNVSTWSICRTNTLLRGLSEAHVALGDSIRNPAFVVDGRLRQFGVVAAQPPFGARAWGSEFALHDPYHRFYRGVPVQSRGEWAFVSHMVEAAAEADGKVGVIVPHGMLARGGAEEKIRQRMMQEQILEAVIGLPPLLFPGTSIPTAVLIFDKRKARAGQVLFVDASRGYAEGKGQNHLRTSDIDRIVAAHRKFEHEPGFACRAALTAIEANGWVLSLPRYVVPPARGPGVDVQALRQEIARGEGELKASRQEAARLFDRLVNPDEHAPG